ncbi:hypothetical protein BD324DRAFT_610777, partial [Kockovaella imperatae]
SLPSRVIELIGVGTRAFAKGLSAAGSQAVKNMKYKPEGMQQSRSSGSGGSSKGGDGARDMPLDEAYMILNVKEADSMEVIRRNYESIFTANGPPKEPEPKPGQPPAPKTRRQVLHSHYLQSKVYRALERIKEERGEVDEPPQAAPTGLEAEAKSDSK